MSQQPNLSAPIIAKDEAPNPMMQMFMEQMMNTPQMFDILTELAMKAAGGDPTGQNTPLVAVAHSLSEWFLAQKQRLVDQGPAVLLTDVINDAICQVFAIIDDPAKWPLTPEELNALVDAAFRMLAHAENNPARQARIRIAHEMISDIVRRASKKYLFRTVLINEGINITNMTIAISIQDMIGLVLGVMSSPKNEDGTVNFDPQPLLAMLHRAASHPSSRLVSASSANASASAPPPAQPEPAPADPTPSNLLNQTPLAQEATEAPAPTPEPIPTEVEAETAPASPEDATDDDAPETETTQNKEP